MVGAVLGSHVDAATAGATVFRGVVAGLDLELFQRIGRGSREVGAARVALSAFTPSMLTPLSYVRMPPTAYSEVEFPKARVSGMPPTTPA